jgi:hypothetical protein
MAAINSPVAGLFTSKVLPDAALIHSPLTYASVFIRLFLFTLDGLNVRKSPL